MRDLGKLQNEITKKDYEDWLVSDPFNASLVFSLGQIMMKWASLLDEKSVLCLLRAVSLLTVEAFKVMDSTEGISNA